MAVAFIHGLSIMMGSGTLRLIEGWPLVLLVVGLIFGAGFKLIWDLCYGYSAARSLIEIIVVGVICYGGIVGFFWYFGNLMHSGKPLFQLQLPTTPTPKS